MQRLPINPQYKLFLKNGQEKKLKDLAQHEKHGCIRFSLIHKTAK
jgi:hypothetical protein